MERVSAVPRAERWNRVGEGQGKGENRIVEDGSGCQWNLKALTWLFGSVPVTDVAWIQ